MLLTQDTMIKTFTVGESPDVVLHNRAGSIRVQRGGDNTVEVRATIRGDWNGGRPEVLMECLDGNTVNIDVRYEWSWKLLGCGGDVHFDIIVPATTDLDLTTNAGTIDVQNVYGQFKLHSNAGTITATQSTLVGFGTLQTNAGTVRFSGSIDPQASYTFQTNAGSVDLLVPENSPLSVEGFTNVGGVHSNLPLTIDRRIPGGSLRGEVGPEPRARVSLQTNAGALSLCSGRSE